VKRITLNVDLEEVRDLLERVPRACVAFADDEGPRVEPVAFVFKDERYLFGMPSSVARHLTANQEVVLVIDDGVQFFDLRALYVRGRVERLDQVQPAASGSFWFDVQPTRTVAWDYKRIREVDDES
jgi:nitroimidazol reductase NimA-like FMN-containing flavoprotein (pyridoxamine 5'-phosphate oxidase superfamily)